MDNNTLIFPCVRLAAIVFPVLFIAPSASARGSDDKGPVGVYSLITVNVAKLPATVSHGDEKISVRSGTIKINESRRRNPLPDGGENRALQ